MDLYKLATRQKLRFTSPKGSVGVEDLWGLSLTTLDAMAREINATLGVESVSFIPGNEGSTNEAAKLKLDILKDVILTKHREHLTLKDAAETAKKKNELMEILNLVKQKELMSKSPEEIQKMIDALGS